MITTTAKFWTEQTHRIVMMQAEALGLFWKVALAPFRDDELRALRILTNTLTDKVNYLEGVYFRTNGG